MSLIDTVNTISADVVQSAPLIATSVINIETAAAHLPGQTKLDLVTSIVLASATAAQNVPIPSVQAIAALVALFVGIFHASGLFQHKAVAAPVAEPVPVPVVLSGV